MQHSTVYVHCSIPPPHPHQIRGFEVVMTMVGLDAVVVGRVRGGYIAKVRLTVRAWDGDGGDGGGTAGVVTIWLTMVV